MTDMTSEQLPSIPGWYLDESNQPWNLTTAGRWIGNSDGRLVEECGPFRRMTVESRDLPPYEDAPPEENFWDDRTIPASDPAQPASLDYVQGVRDALDVIADGLKRHGNVDPEDIYQARIKFYGGAA